MYSVITDARGDLIFISRKPGPTENTSGNIAMDHTCYPRGTSYSFSLPLTYKMIQTRTDPSKTMLKKNPKTGSARPQGLEAQSPSRISEKN